MPKFAIKNALFGYFLTRIWEEYCHNWNQHPRICIIAKFWEKTKYALIWDQKIPYLPIFGMQFENNIVIFCNEHPRICQIGRFREKKKMPKFGTKNALFFFFFIGIWKKYCHIWNQHPRICLTGKFREKTKMPKFVTKNALFGYFWTGIW